MIKLLRPLLLHLKPRLYRKNGQDPKRISDLRILLTIGGATGIVYTFTPLGPIIDNSFSLLQGLVRFFRSITIGLLISFDYTFSKLGLNELQPNYNVMVCRIHQRSANRLLRGCLSNGGSYIKLGQGLVSMDHILPTEYIQTLKQLQDQCLIRKQDEVKILFLEDFGKKPEELFKQFEPEPIAAASLAQVYKATTHEDETVAVKVQYIDLQKRFDSDVSTIQLILNLIGVLHKDFNFKWILDELRDSLRQELNFVHEGRNAERCARDLSHMKHVYVPKIHWDISSTRVLVTEFIDGYKISDLKALKENGFDLADIDKKLFQAFGEQIFKTGFVHADPHPGNILIRKHSKQTQLVLLDHGLYQCISEKDRIALSHMWKAIVLHDHKRMDRYSKELGVQDHVLFAEVLTQMPLEIKKFKLTKVTEGEINYIKEFVAKRFESVMSVLRQMPSQLLLILRNLNTIRSITMDHGNPIDQYEVLARCATRYAFRNDQNLVFRFLVIPSKIYFEIQLFKNKVDVWMQRIILKVLKLLGRPFDFESLDLELVM